MRRTILTTALLIAIAPLAIAQSLTLTQSRASGVYQKGDHVRVVLSTKDVNKDSVTVIAKVNYSQEVAIHPQYEGDSAIIWDKKVGEAISIIFEAKYKTELASIGYIVSPEQLNPGTSRPADFDRYWETLRKQQANIPIRALTNDVAVEKGFKCSHVELNGLSKMPARGYIAMPNEAKPKSLPIVIYFHAAGVSGDWCLAKPENAVQYAKMGNGAICLDINAHGILDGQPLDYYKNLEQGELKDYFFRGIENRDSFYFRDMYLRLLRAIDYLTTLPEWDGKRILVYGESQGGGQALVAAGLDPRVTAVVAIVPALCDWGGAFAGRRGGWPQPFDQTQFNRDVLLSTLPYFDAAHILKGAKADMFIEIGLIDMVCPSTSIFAAINQAQGSKTVYTVPYRDHHVSQKRYLPQWESSVLKARLEFITNHLK